MGDGVAVINSGEETASEVSALLDYHNLLDATDEEIEHRFFHYGLDTNFQRYCKRLVKYARYDCRTY